MFIRTFDEQLEQRLRLQQEQEAELEELIVVDADAFNDTKRRMERDIALLSDQIQFLDAIHQVRTFNPRYTTFLPVQQ